MKNEHRRLGVNELGARLGVGRKTIKMWADIGILHPVYYSNRMLFKSTADIDFFNEWEGYNLNTEELARGAMQQKKIEELRKTKS